MRHPHGSHQYSNTQPSHAAHGRCLRLSAFYTTLPAASILSVPVVSGLGGWSVLSSEAGSSFGVPGFLPWPLDTILGFAVLVAGIAVAAKVAVTTTVAGAEG